MVKFSKIILNIKREFNVIDLLARWSI